MFCYAMCVDSICVHTISGDNLLDYILICANMLAHIKPHEHRSIRNSFAHNRYTDHNHILNNLVCIVSLLRKNRA